MASQIQFNDKPMVRVGPLLEIPAVIRSLGRSPEPVFRASGFQLTEFVDPDHRVPFAQASLLLSNSVAATECGHIGLLIGARCTPSHLGLGGFVAKCAPNVEIGLRALVEHFDLHDGGGALALDIGPTCTTLGYFVHTAEAAAVNQIYDLSASVMCQLMRALCGSAWRARQVNLSRRRPPDTSPYEQCFQAKLNYDATELSVTFDSHWLRETPPHSDPLLYRYLQKEGEREHGVRVARLTDSLPGVLRNGLATERFSAGEVAATLGIHERTLHRRLKAAGTTFRRELDAIRAELSTELLENTELAVNAVASALGYADSSSFIRAFQRWHGSSPSHWREQAAQAAGSRRLAAKVS